MRSGAMRRGALVGATTYADVRDVMIGGESGLLAAGAGEGLRFEPSKRQVHWPDGAMAQAVTAEEPDGLRGHQFSGAWLDEFSKAAEPQKTLDMLLMALRIAENPRAVVTTTPHNIPAFKALLAMPGVAVTHSRTFANAANLAPAFLEQMRLHYAGTRLGRQELDGELIEGKKTYVIAALAAVTAAAQALGYTIPDWAYALEGALGLGALRVAVSKGWAVTWLGVLSALLTAVGTFAGWLRTRQLIAAGHAQTDAATLKSGLDESAAANEARDAVRVALEREPQRLRDDDGFKRAD